MATKELELSITEVEINGKNIPISGRLEIKLNMGTDEVGKRQLLHTDKGSIVFKGQIVNSEPLSLTRKSRSWNMNVSMPLRVILYDADNKETYYCTREYCHTDEFCYRDTDNCKFTKCECMVRKRDIL